MRAPWALVVLVVALTIASSGMPMATAAPGSAAVQKQFAFRNAMRMLWEDHIVWTRLYIVSVAADLPDKDIAAYEKIHKQILHMADMLSAGIINQFPAKFR